MNAPEVITREILGHPTDFLFETKTDGDKITLTVTTVFPPAIFDGRELRAFKPPRFPWADVNLL